MNLANKKELAKKVLGVGKNRIIFSTEGLSEIKEAITKQDIQSLYDEGIIRIKPIKGRKKVEKRTTRRGPGKIRKTIKRRKQVYVKITRKLRAHLQSQKNQGKLEHAQYKDLRKKIKMRFFRSKAHLQEHLANETKLKASESQEKINEGSKSDKKTKLKKSENKK